MKNIYNELKKEFPNDNAVFAIMGNIKAESGLKATNLQNSCERRIGLNDITYTQAVDSGAYDRTKFTKDSAGYGLCQWTYWTRKGKLYDFAKANSKSIGDEIMQIDFLIYELKNNYRGLYDILKTSDDLEKCTELFMTLYERPANQSRQAINGRIALAKKVRSAFNINPASNEYYPVPNYSGGSIIDALKSINVVSSKKNRTIIANINGIENYTGTASQNKFLINLLLNGKLKK